MAAKGQDVVEICHGALPVLDILDKVSDPSAGATASFLGTTRDNFKGKKVVHLEYEAYVPMALKEMRKICTQIRRQWDICHICIYHRLGIVPVKEASVVIAISSAHREGALKGVEYAINALKATVPIWKLEQYEGDDRMWKENAEWDGGRAMKPTDT